MPIPTHMAERYIDVWNQTDPVKRRSAVDELFCPEARYIDPQVEAQGREQIDATIAAVQAQFPQFAFRLVGPVDAHHDQARFSWELGPAGDPAPIAGFDVAVTDDAGHLELVLGFLDRNPSAGCDRSHLAARLGARAHRATRRLCAKTPTCAGAGAAV